jgi:hypothetical protein
MFKSLDIENQMEVVGSDGKHVGTVDHMQHRIVERFRRIPGHVVLSSLPRPFAFGAADLSTHPAFPRSLRGIFIGTMRSRNVDLPRHQGRRQPKPGPQERPGLAHRAGSPGFYATSALDA